MRLRRSLPIIVAVLLVAAAVALVVVLRKHAPPEPARLLPGADGFAYVNLQWMRRANLLGELPPVPHDPEYEQFIQATGFEFERDLDEAAFAIHYSSSGSQPRFSEIFVGKIQTERLRSYLAKLSSSTENYRSVEVYNIPVADHTLRVAILGLDTVASSNIDDPTVIQGIINRSRKLASPFAGPALLRQYYKHVPLASEAWGIFRVQPNTGFHGTSWAFLFQTPAVVVTSVRYLRSLNLRAVAFTSDEGDAKQLTERFVTFFDLFHAAEVSAGAQAPDPDVKALLDSLKIEQQKNRAIVTATVPLGFLRKALAEAPVAATAPEHGAETVPQSNAAKPLHK
ncbi:MAG TPA: hypothetical protein VEI49_09295 [Terriglobales bacterium]|nr:hypothetical protein [Terriglobales bacterium]